MIFIRWLSNRNVFFWIGLSGMIITALIHLIIYYYQGTHITRKFNFYLVWIIFLIAGLLSKK
jgi:hypothetical protein